ncbi:DUF5994 family protein [Actinophytocola sediminis]
MTSGPHLRVVPAAAATELRLTLKPEAPATGFVDGVWWPRSRDLTTELPALLTELSARLGQIQAVSYNLDTWDPAPRRLLVNGQRVRLGGYMTQHPHGVDVVGLNGSRLVLLALSPETDPRTARQTMAATEPGDLSEDVAVQRWELDGGRVHRWA